MAVMATATYFLLLFCTFLLNFYCVNEDDIVQGWQLNSVYVCNTLFPHFCYN